MKTITVKTNINAPISEVWEFFTKPQHITKWNQATDEWHSPHAENDLQRNGKFSYRMEEREGSNGFDFSGKYSDIKNLKKLIIHLTTGAKWKLNSVLATTGNQPLFSVLNQTPITLKICKKKAGSSFSIISKNTWK